MPPSAHAAGETTEAATSQATEAPSAASGPIAVTPRFRINRANEPGFVRPAEKFIAPQAPVLNLRAFGQVLGSLTDYNLASADEDDLSVLRSIAPSHHRYIVEIDPNGLCFEIGAFHPRCHSRTSPLLDLSRFNPNCLVRS